MLKKYITGVLFCLLSATTIAQDDTKPADEEVPKPLFGDKKIRPIWMEKLRYGGNFYAQLGNFSGVDVSPMLGYEIGNSGKTVVGTSLTLNFNGQFKTGDWGYGARVFMRQNIIRGIFAHAEFEMMNAKEYYFVDYNPPKTGSQLVGRTWGGTPYLGLGYYQGNKRTKGPFIAILINPLFRTKGYQSPLTIGGEGSPLNLRIGFF